MISALLIGRKGSTGFPGKNTSLVLGKPLAWYPMRAAAACPAISNIYLSTDDTDLARISTQFKINLIERPPELATSTALGEHVFVHGYNEICKRERCKPQAVVLLFCNSATILESTIEKSIDLLLNTPSADSVVTVSKYNMWSPLRARKLNNKGELIPFVPFEVFGDPTKLSCDRDSQGDILFADMGCSVVRPENLENLESGLLPQKWMGKKILPFYQEAGCDVDYEWQVPIVEWWLKKNLPHHLLS